MPDNSITINDPISGDIQAVCSALEAALTFLATPQGQAIVALWIANGQQFNTAIADAGKWIEGLFKRPTA